MFIKLLKHEFRATRRTVPFIYLATMFMILVNLLTRQLDIGWVSGFMMIMMIGFGAVQILMTYIVVFARYYKNLYNSEGYLTHTLPVPPRKLLASKAVVAFFWLLISYILMAGVIVTTLILIISEQAHNLSLPQVLDQLIAGSGIQKTYFYAAAAGFAAYLLLAIANLLAQVYFAITVGNLAVFHKMGIAAPILAYLSVYFAQQTLTLVAIVFIPLGIKPVGDTLQIVPEGMLTTISNPDYVIIGLGPVFIMVLMTVALLYATSRFMARGTSLK